MTPGRGWNEAQLSENPAVAQLQRLGFTYVPAEALEAERQSLREVVLTGRLAAALKKLNPWLSEDNVHKAVRAVTSVQATDLIEANEKVYTALTYGIALEQDRQEGKRSYNVRFIDFETPGANELVVTRQFRIQGQKKHVIPDLVVFVNGLPLAVIECKSPTLGPDWLPEAVDQLWRYQELGPEYRDLGAPRLFEAAQLLVVTCGQAARYGTVGTPQRFFAEWKSTWPKTGAALARELGHEPTPQERLFEGMLTPANLLDIVRNFVAFERDPTTGRTVRKLCRYQQFAAVNKAIARAKAAKSPEARGGVVWHTQGSGKSLTMLWLAAKLRRDPELGNPTLVVVTDRKDLDTQIAETFVHCGFPNPERAESVRDLRERLAGAVGKTVMTTVQKFQEVTGVTSDKRRQPKGPHPVLSTASNLFVLTDEAHRTQYGTLAANLRKALPNACFFGFTGTPIDKEDRSTLQTFGQYIDQYTIEEAVTDGATVPIYYEGRLADVRIAGQNLDRLFERVFADRSDEERAAIKSKYATDAAIAGAPKRVEAIALDLIEHFTTYIRPNGFKAQVVAVSREVAATYKEALDRLQAPQSALVVSTSNKDNERLVRLAARADDRQKTIDRFCDPEDPLAILVVCDMLLTGFDAPVEQVMYLDSPLKEHSLLQAIARVNRPADKKNYGLVVDYWGVSENLQEALRMFAPTDVQGAMTPKVDELPRLHARHQAVLRFFLRVEDKDDLDQCVAVLEPEDVRAEFDVAFKRFQTSMDVLLPDPRALAYADDLRWLGKIRQAAATRYRDRRLDISDCGEKVRKLIEEAITADGIQLLVKQVSIFSKDFGDRLAQLKSDEARASEMEHAIKAEIHVRLEEDPAFYASLRERLERLIEDRKAKRIDAAQQLLKFEALVQEMRGRVQRADEVGLSRTGLAIYDLLERAVPAKAGEGHAGYDASRKDLVNLIEEGLAPQVAIIDWTQKEDVQREAKKRIKRQLSAAGFKDPGLGLLTNEIVDLLKAREGR